MLTRAQLAATIVAIFAACSTSACRCRSDKESAKKPAAPSASASVATPAPKPPVRRTLAKRETPSTASLISARNKLLDALARIKTLRQKKKGAEALSLVMESRYLDPLGSALAVEAGRAASLAGNDLLAEAWAFRALETAPSKVVIEAARPLLGFVAPEALGSDMGSFDSIQAACAALEERVRADKPPPTGLGPVASAKCEIEYDLELEAASVTRASALRVTSADGTRVVAWVGMHTPTRIKVYGPVGAVYVPPELKLTNDFIVDLQKVDVLPAGGPEVVVKIDERRTFADVALNELAEVDRTRVLLLTLDRGKLEASREFVLSYSQRRSLIDTKDRRLPAGWKQSTDLGKTADYSYSMAVAWTGPNEVTLSQVTGSDDPRDWGRIVLFP